MIIGWIRLAFFMLLGLTVVYLVTAVYSRSVRREKLEKRWEAEGLAERAAENRDAYVEKGMQAYEKGLKRRLLWLIYIIPMVAFSVIFFYSNWGRL